MGTKQEIEKTAKEISKMITSIRMRVNYKQHLDRKETDELLLKLDIKFCEFMGFIDHFKPKSVTSEEKLKELVENTFGIDALEDKDLMYLYSECLKYAVEEIVNERVISDSEIINSIERWRTGMKVLSDMLKTTKLNTHHIAEGHIKDMDTICSKLSKQTEPSDKKIKESIHDNHTCKDNWVKCSCTHPELYVSGSWHKCARCNKHIE